MDVYVDDGVYTEDKETKEEASMESGLTILNVRNVNSNAEQTVLSFYPYT